MTERAARRRRGPVEAAVARELRALLPNVRRSPMAMAALELGKRLDRSDCEPCEECGCEGLPPTSDRDAATLTRELRAALGALPRPVIRARDMVEEQRAKREARRRGG